MTIFTKGDRVFRACVLEFEGELIPVVVPGIVATVNPQRDGTQKYNVRELDLLGTGRTSFTTYAREPGELFSDPVEAMRIGAAHMAKLRKTAADVAQ